MKDAWGLVVLGFAYLALALGLVLVALSIAEAFGRPLARAQQIAITNAAPPAPTPYPPMRLYSQCPLDRRNVPIIPEHDA